MPTGEITLRDLIAWTDLVSARDDTATEPDDLLDRDVDWVVTARATPPMLPTLRGGELVLLPERVVTESALNLQMLMQELTSQPVAGVVLDTEEPVRSPLPVLRTRRIDPELESDLNRLLTTRRGELLRAGTDVERIVTARRSLHATPLALLQSLAELVGVGLAVRTTAGNLVVGTGDPPPPRDLARAGWLSRPLARNRVLLIGPLPPDRRALGRLLLERAADAVQAALDEEASSAQDLQTRTRLLNHALAIAATDPQEAGSLLRQAGIRPDAPFRVAVAPVGSNERETWPLIRALGTPIDAGTLGEGPAWLLTELTNPPRVVTSHGDAWVVVSAPVGAAAELVEATRQIAYLMTARRAGVIDGAIVRADDIARLGAVRLLQELWGTPLLAEFVDATVGGLLREDRRGQLRETLAAYLAHGGAQRATAEALGIHRNTLTYRLRQIRGLLGADPDDPAARLSLHLALVASQLPPPGGTHGR